MVKFPVKNIDIRYDVIQDEWLFRQCDYLSKRKIKRVVYDFVYGRLNNDHLEKLGNANARIEVYYHAGWNAPVVSCPSAQEWFNVKPYTCKEICFFFYRDDYKIILKADNKKDMYVKLLELYEKGLNSWMNSYNNDMYKTKRERYRLNAYKKS